MKTITLVVALMFVGLNSSTAQTRAERKAIKKEKQAEAFQQMKTIIESGEFEFVARRAIPLSSDISRLNFRPNNIFQGNAVDMTTNTNFLRLNKDSLSVAMPFFGRVFRTTGAFGIDNGIKFNGLHEDYSIKFNDKKRMIILSFDADGENDYMQFVLNVGSLSMANLTVNTNNRQSITYQGFIKPLKTESKSSK